VTAIRPGKPRRLIPPTRVIRRANAKRWHLRDGTELRSMCGQRWRSIYTADTAIIRHADQIGCTDCIVESIGRRLRPKGPPTRDITP
jgi:hypothetical protein